MKADGAGNGVDEDGIGDRTGDDVGEVNFEKVGAPKHWTIVEVADTDEDQEDKGESVTYRGKNS